MDSLTQAVLGGAVGTAVAGKALGRRAALWGAVAGTLPDLDVLAYPFLDTAGELIAHRGVTHGLAFALVVGPALGWLAVRLQRWRAAPQSESAPPPVGPVWTRPEWRVWTTLFVAALVTHPLLDVFTVYGTQLLAPFSRRPFAVGSVFIIDPLYTVPLALFLLAAVVRRAPRLAVIGLAVSTAYLGWGVAAQTVVEGRARRALGDARLLVTPMPLQSLLWRVVTESGGTVTTYEHSLLGPGWLFEAAGSSPLADLAAADGTRGAETLDWFSRGWLVADPTATRGDAAGVADARFGCGPSGYVFRWSVAPDGAVQQQAFSAGVPGGALARYARRVFYVPPVPPPAPCPGVAETAPPPRPAPNRSDDRSFTEPIPQTTQPPPP